MIRHRIENRRPEGLSALESLIFPLSPENFFADFWQKKPVYREGEAAQAINPIETEQFLFALFEAGVGAKQVHFTRPGGGDEERCRDTFFRIKSAWQEPPTMEQLAREITGGTLVFDALEKRIEGAREWCKNLSKPTGCPTTINGYFGSSEGASAFGAHTDAQDVFILQLEGIKDWALWDLATDRGDEAPSRPADHMARLSPGDVLYVPRGMWHWPKTVGDHPSFHLTVTLVAPQAKDVVRWLESALDPHAFAHKLLPTAPLLSDDPATDEDLSKTIEFLRKLLSSEDAQTRAALHLKMENLLLMHKAARK